MTDLKTSFLNWPPIFIQMNFLKNEWSLYHNYIGMNETQSVAICVFHRVIPKSVNNRPTEGISLKWDWKFLPTARESIKIWKSFQSLPMIFSDIFKWFRRKPQFFRYFISTSWSWPAEKHAAISIFDAHHKN